MSIRDGYDIDRGRWWLALMCYFLGHQIYRARGWYFIEFGCHRCGLKVKHQWADPDAPDDIAESE